MNRYFLTILLLAACESGDRDLALQPAVAKSHSDEGAYIVDSSLGSLKGVRVGMNESELSSLGYSETRATVILEGDEYVTVNVIIDGKVVLNCIVDEGGAVYRFSTSSLLVRDEKGVGVGTALHELRVAYPEGKLVVGNEEGRYASFANGSKVIFSLDQSKIDDLCFDEPTEKCEFNDQEIRVEELVVHQDAG